LRELAVQFGDFRFEAIYVCVFVGSIGSKGSNCLGKAFSLLLFALIVDILSRSRQVLMRHSYISSQNHIMHYIYDLSHGLFGASFRLVWPRELYRFGIS